VFDILAYGFIGALGQVRDFLKAADIIRIIKNVEVVGFVDIPVELCVQDLVFSIIREIDHLRKAEERADQNEEQKEKASMEKTCSRKC